MRRVASVLITALLLVAAVVSPAAAATARSGATAYTFVDLGTLGGESSYATAINDRGQVAGSSQVADGSWHGFVWRDGVMTDLGLLRPTGLNNRGDVIGITDTSAYLLRGGQLIDLGPGFYPVALNDRRQIIGTAGLTTVLWANGTTTPLPLGSVSGINNRGRISGSTGSHAAVWQAGTVTDLGAGPFDRSNTYGINAAGWVIGWHFSSAQSERGILWRTGVATDLGTLGGGTTHLTAINDRGQVLGTSQRPDGTMHPVRWQNGVLTDLTTLGVNASHDLAGLSDNGRIAVSFRPVFGVSHAGLCL